MGTDVTVLGAGVIGLSCASVLAEAGARVRIVTAEPPDRTTSAAATGMAGPVIDWGPHGDGRTVGWELATVAHLQALAGTAGVRIATGLAAAPSEPAAPLSIADRSLLRPAEPHELPAGFGFGMWVRLPLVDVPVHLQYLLDRAVAAGAAVEQRRATDLADAAGSAPVLVNCSGLGARTLCDDQDVHAVKGQQVVVANPGLDGFFMPAPGPAEWASWHAHGEHVLLGGVRHAHDTDPHPSPSIAEGILARCAALEPRLAGARVLGHRAGLRPERSRVRLEAELIDGQRGDLRVVHCYGHGGTGVLQSWGCAREVAGLAL